MPNIRTFNQERSIALEQQFVNQETVVAESDLVGKKVTVCGVIESLLTVMRRGAKRVKSHSAVVKVNPPVMKWPKQTYGDLHPANLLTLTTGNFTNAQRLKPRIME
jgi:hypothetical protein